MIGIEYAKSLMEIHPDINLCMDEFNAFNSVYDELCPIMRSPGISIDEKHQIIDKAFKSFTKEFIYFLYVVIDNNRFQYLDEIFKEFKKLYDLKNNMTTCDVYTSNKLDNKEKQSIIKYLEKELNKKVVLNEIIDKNIAGIKIIADGKTIDYSLENRINNMRFSI